MRTFPIFINVERKPPLVTGGGELAAVKARLLLKRAEIVDIAAGELGLELAELERAGRVALIPARPGIDQIGQELSGPDRGQLIHIADEDHRSVAGNCLEQVAGQWHIDHRALVSDQKVAVQR